LSGYCEVVRVGADFLEIVREFEGSENNEVIGREGVVLVWDGEEDA
jgi:hypothetical protein